MLCLLSVLPLTAAAPPSPPPLPDRRCCCSPGNPRDPIGEESSPGAAPRQVHGGRAVWGRPRGRAWTQPPCVLQVAQRSLRGALLPSSCCTATVPGQPCPLQGRRWRRVQSQHRVPSALPRQRTHVACGAAPFLPPPPLPLTNSLCSRSRNKCPSPCPVPTALLGALHKVGTPLGGTVHWRRERTGKGQEVHEWELVKGTQMRQPGHWRGVCTTVTHTKKGRLHQTGVEWEGWDQQAHTWGKQTKK